MLQVTLSHPNKSCSEALGRFILPTENLEPHSSPMVIWLCRTAPLSAQGQLGSLLLLAEPPLGNEDVCSKHVQKWREASMGQQERQVPGSPVWGGGFSC